MNTETSLSETVARTVEDLPDPPLARRDLRDIGPGLAGMVAVPDDSGDDPRVRLHFPNADVVARFEDDAGAWTVETVEGPDEAV